MPSARTTLNLGGGLLAGASAVQGLYLVGLLAAAAPRLTAHEAPEARPSALRHLTVLMPAHDEESGIADAVRSVLAAEYPEQLLTLIVVADNCTDDTERRATQAGAVVWARRDDDRRGKGHALAWALDRVMEDFGSTSGVVFIDADCSLSPGALVLVNEAFSQGADAIQMDYAAGNETETTTAALRGAGYRLMNTVRPAGKEQLGLSVGLVGTGMAFTLETILAVPWTATSLVEDAEHHLRLVSSGRRVRFLQYAAVTSNMPTTTEGARSQQERWESGRWEMATRHAPRLFLLGVGRRDYRLVSAAADSYVLPQSLQTVTWVAAWAIGALTRSRRLNRLAALGGASQVLYVIGGLAATRAPSAIWKALFSAPVLVARKLLLAASLSAGGAPTEFVRTQRSTDQAPGSVSENLER